MREPTPVAIANTDGVSRNFTSDISLMSELESLFDLELNTHDEMKYTLAPKTKSRLDRKSDTKEIEVETNAGNSS